MLIPCGAASVVGRGATEEPVRDRTDNEVAERAVNEEPMGADARHDQAAMPSLLIEAVNMLFDHYGKPPIA